MIFWNDSTISTLRDLVSKGYTAKEIASRLGTTPKSVYYYKSKHGIHFLREKLPVDNYGTDTLIDKVAPKVNLDKVKKAKEYIPETVSEIIGYDEDTDEPIFEEQTVYHSSGKLEDFIKKPEPIVEEYIDYTTNQVYNMNKYHTLQDPIDPSKEFRLVRIAKAKNTDLGEYWHIIKNVPKDDPEDKVYTDLVNYGNESSPEVNRTKLEVFKQPEYKEFLSTIQFENPEMHSWILDTMVLK